MDDSPEQPPGTGSHEGDAQGDAGWVTPPGWGEPGGPWATEPAPAAGPPPQAGGRRTGPLPLYPMALGDLLDSAFRLLKADLKTLLLVTAALIVPLELISAILARDLLNARGGPLLFDSTAFSDSSVTVSGAEILGIALASLGLLLVTPLIGAAVTKVVAASYLGQELTAGDALRAAVRRFPALLGAFVMIHLLEIVATLFCLLPGLVAMAFFLCATPAIMLEDLGAFKGMGRSASLVKFRFWPVLGIGVLSGLLGLLLALILRWPFTLMSTAGSSWAFIPAALGSIVPELLVIPFVSIVATLVYYDIRIRFEGLDLQMIAQGLAGGAAPA